MSSGVTWSMSPCMIHSNPSRTPSTSTASNRARIVAAPITLLIPGAGPPPTRIASVLRSVIAVSLPSRGPGAPLAPREDQDRCYRRVHDVLLRARFGELGEALRQGEGVAELGVAHL